MNTPIITWNTDAQTTIGHEVDALAASMNQRHSRRIAEFILSSALQRVLGLDCTAVLLVRDANLKLIPVSTVAAQGEPEIVETP